ncbi:hypothetical protein EDC04DRAFT_2213753 [Pisolithus marmoratus]|nr:hypothetical protein EDC04DRAFT_2213753 [Pisolithus marmoratus]
MDVLVCFRCTIRHDLYHPTDALPPRIRQDPFFSEIASAYNLCRDLEERIQREIASGKEMEKEMIHCRILGFLFHHFPARDIKPFVREILKCGHPQDLLTLGEPFYGFLVQLLKANKGPTPAPSSHPSRPLFDNLTDMIENMLQEGPKNHQTAKKYALARDGFRCAVTKVYDFSAVCVNKELEMKVERDGAWVVTTQCAHIFPEPTTANTAAGSGQAKYDASIWAVLDCFGYSSLREELNRPNIHRLENIWFTETGRPNEYKLEGVHAYVTSRYPTYVTFSTPDPKKLPLPSPTYLAIRAAFAKVAHLSGAVEYIEKILRRLEGTLVLAEDGGSAELLHTAILSSMDIVSV